MRQLPRTAINVLLVALILRLPLFTIAAAPLFDEVFYLPAARAFLAGLPDPNFDQPPLAKLLMAGSIALFGDNPLGWRIPSLVLGVASVGLVYMIALRLTKSTKAAAMVALLLALDPLHIVLSRVGMLDMFMFTFGMAGLYALLNIRTDVHGDQDLKRWALSGGLFGLAVASKWPAAFMLIGALVFVLLSTRQPRKGLLMPIAVMLAAVAVVYTLTYLPLILRSGPQAFIDLQLTNLKMHLNFPANGQASPPLGWLVGRRPVWFGWNKPDFPVPGWLLFIPNLFHSEAVFAVIAMVNPFICWPAEIALLVLGVRWLLNIYRSKVKKRKLSAKVRLSDAGKFSLVWFIATWLPWLISPRAQTMLYYMLPVLPAFFIALATFVQRNPRRWAVPAVIAAAVLSLLILYPLTILLPMPTGYLEALRWWVGVPPPPL